MARFDLYQARNGSELVLDCQVDALEFPDSRFVVPMLPRTAFVNLSRVLNPVLEVEGNE